MNRPTDYWKQKRKGRPRKMVHVVEDGKLILLQFSKEAKHFEGEDK